MLAKDMVAASAKPLLLSILAGGESYGYEIIQKVRELSGGQIEWSDGMLYPVLHRLERDGLIERRVISTTHPPGVEYALTELGRSLTAQIETLMQWIRDHMTQILQARARFSEPAEPEA